MNLVHEQTSPQLAIECCFSEEEPRAALSPVDEFIRSIISINKLCEDPLSMPNELGHLMVLGYVSAVESYIRSLLVRIIGVDEASNVASAREPIPFSSALNHDREIMTEALFEDLTFLNVKSISESLVRYLGFKRGPAERMVKNIATQYIRVCQVRHCIVHRFGKLGSKNAWALGFEDHKENVEKTIILKYDKIQEMATICDNFVRSLNNYCYGVVLSRTHHDGWVRWSGDLRKDRSRFSQYHEIFASCRHRPASPGVRDAYNEFRDKVLSLHPEPGSFQS
ncbi:hypothetical protein [Thioalkalivibrio sp. ALE16]|uniref:hypothetical protein n=1 Tax=Thioalkalivibrio sp. ALE16 TaxID=1158172 RepID=UPI0012DCA88A|nr:hypothetical protein [Thioalkalivibrio sp. ALE16]